MAKSWRDDYDEDIIRQVENRDYSSGADALNMSDADYAQVLRNKSLWANADEAGRAALHDDTERIRAGYGYSGGAAGNDYIRLGSDVGSGRNYSTGGADAIHMSDADYAQVQRNKALWNSADAAGRAALHDDTEKIRAKYGYSGGVSGDEYIKLAPFTYENAGEYVSKYQGTLDSLQAQILGREPFSYNYEDDPVWQAYKQQYTREGQRSTQDTMGQYATMTGGLPSTAAVTAAQQAGDYYNAQMTDKIPELYRLAYDMYLQEGDDLMRRYNMVQGADDTAYGRWADTENRAHQYYREGIDDQRYETEYADAMAQQALENEWNVRDFEESKRRYEQEYALAIEERDYERAAEIAAVLASAGDFSRYRALGLSDSEIQTLTNAYYANLYGTGGGGGGSSGRRRSGGSKKTGSSKSESFVITNAHADNNSWINVPGMGRFTPSELERMVGSSVVEIVGTNSDGQTTLTYRKASDSGSESSGKKIDKKKKK